MSRSFFLVQSHSAVDRAQIPGTSNYSLRDLETTLAKQQKKTLKKTKTTNVNQFDGCGPSGTSECLAEAKGLFSLLDKVHDQPAVHV